MSVDVCLEACLCECGCGQVEVKSVCGCASTTAQRLGNIAACVLKCVCVCVCVCVNSRACVGVFAHLCAC